MYRARDNGHIPQNGMYQSFNLLKIKMPMNKCEKVRHELTKGLVVK